MSIENIIGILMVASVLVGLFRLIAHDIGYANTLVILAISIVITAVLVIGVFLITN